MQPQPNPVLESNRPGLAIGDYADLTPGLPPGPIGIKAVVNALPWQPFTFYVANQLVTNGGTTYIADIPHLSGASFSAGTNWSVFGSGGGSTANLVPRAGGATPTAQPLPFINVLDYGAAFNGDTSGQTDDTAAIQAALNAATSIPNQGVFTGNDQVAIEVRMPAGRTYIAGTLVLPANVILRGAGIESTYIVRAPSTITTAPITLAAGAVAVTLCDFAIHCNSQASCIDFTWRRQSEHPRRPALHRPRCPLLRRP